MMALINGVFEEIEEEPKVVATCSICGQEIYDYETYMEMPDGEIVCDDYDCIYEWAKQYRKGDN